MRLRRSFALVTGLSLVLMMQGGIGRSAPQASDRSQRVAETTLPDGFLPAMVRARQLGRYFVEMKAPAVADAVLSRGTAASDQTSAPQQQAAASAALRAQEAAIAQARSLGDRSRSATRSW